MGDVLGGIGRGLLDILGGAHALKRQETEGFDWREKQAQAEFLRQQERERARQENERAEAEQDARLQGQVADIISGSGEGETPDLDSLLPQNIEYLRRQRILKGALGLGKERKSALLSQRLEADKAKAEAARQARLEVLAKTQEGQRALQEARLNAGRDLSEDEQKHELDMLGQRLGAQRANLEYRATHPTAGSGGKLRVEFNREIKPYRDIQENYQRLKAAATSPSGANDVAIIFNYMKMLDPASVVREGEFATAQEAGINVPDRIWQMYRRARAGERLTPRQRQQFLASGREQYRTSAFPAIRQLTSQYGRLAENSGISPEDVTGGFLFQDIEDEEDAPRARPAGRPTPRSSDGGLPRPRSAAEFAALPSGTSYIDPNGQRRRKP